MSVDLRKVVVRMANDGDYEGVVGVVPNLYSGRDYLPAFYNEMLKDPKRFLIVAELKAEIIGLEMYFVVDDDKTIIAEGGRIKEAYRGTGLSKQIMQYGLANIYKQYPAVKWLSFTSQNEERTFSYVQKTSLETYFHRHLVRILVTTQKLLSQDTSSSGLLPLCSHSKLFGLTKIATPSEALQALDNLIGHTDVLTEHAWMINYEPFRPIQSNHVTVTHHNTRGQPTLMVTRCGDCDTVALSFGNVTPISEGVMFTIDFYCHRKMRQNEKGKLLLQVHIAKHVILFNQLKGNGAKIFLDVLLPKEMNTQDVLDCYRYAGVKDYDIVERKRRVYCTEANIEMLSRI